MVEVLTLSRSDVRQVFTMRDAIRAVEDAYRAHGEGKTINPLATSFIVPKYNGEVDIKPAYIETIECAGLKLAGGYWDNPEKFGLPSVIGIIVLTDGRNGMPLAIMDGTHIGSFRTGAAGGVGAKYLARKDSERVAVIGSGNQARQQLAALAEVFPVKRVKAYSLNAAHRAAYADEMGKKYGIDVAAADSVKEAVRGADIIVTATPATGHVLMDEWVKPGTHINAIGADMPGKQELDPRIMARAKVVVDSLPQCVRIGEVQTAIREGIIREEDIYAEIGEIVAGKKRGRTSPDEVTVFDSTGMGIQDVSSAHSAYLKAKERGLGKPVEFF